MNALALIDSNRSRSSNVASLSAFLSIDKGIISVASGRSQPL
jgi:hypothetical protein